MQCPNCGAQLNDGDAFCGNCGAGAPQPHQQPQQYQQPYQQQYAPAAPPAKPSRKGLKIALVIIVLLAVLGVCCAGAGAFFYFRNKGTPSVEPTPPAVAPEPTQSNEPEDGFATPEEAVQSVIDSDWVMKLVTDEPDFKEFWVGPPQSEFVTAYIVTRTAGGGWAITDEYPIGASDVTMEDADEAIIVVEDFLLAIVEDRPSDAQALTIDPFRSDPASAQYSNGEFKYFTIDSVDEEPDGTFWITASEVWTYGTTEMMYHVVPTEIGWRIRDATVK